MSGQHTPGPWVATRSLHDSRVVICTEHGVRIDVATTYAGGCGVPVVGTTRHDDPDWYQALDAAVTKARKALSDATGGGE